ncbi:MAG: Gx transporter family protein [Ruminococcaceae bacterium]|nr:Gx transporter family protein [Oscillospiraceae bacterium]
MNRKTKQTALLGLCASLALVLAYVEALLPPIVAAVPGVKLGLPNIVLVFLLYRCGVKQAAVVSLVRIVLLLWLFGNAMSFYYSLAGATLSLVAMALLKRWDFLSTVGVSVAGAVLHNVGQILVAMLLLNTAELGYYLVVLAITGTVAGVLIGLCGALAIRRIPKKLF